MSNIYSFKVRHKDSNKENSIIEKTLEIVYETGIAGLKMSILAKRVGVSPSTLYVYFKTKEDLINSIAFKLINEISDSLDHDIVAAGSFELGFKAKWLHLFNFLLNKEREVNFLDQWKQSPYFNKESLGILKDNMKVASDLFKYGKENGILKDLDDKVIHAVMSGIAKQLIAQVKEGFLQIDNTSMDKYYQLVWDALKK